jgi:PRTRC genetic system protein B
MNTTLDINGSIEMALSDALMIYRTKDGRAAYVTHHNVTNGQLGAATALTGQFLNDLQEQLRKRIKMELLPENVLARTNEAIVWWTPAQKRRMFFTDAEEMATVSGLEIPQPALVWMVNGDDLTIRALLTSERPTATTPLYIAPYWNVSSSGDVCLGDSPTPETVTTANLDAWVDGFFASRFSHPNAAKLIKGAGRYHTFLNTIARFDEFPTMVLIDAKQTLSQFIGGYED